MYKKILFLIFLALTSQMPYPQDGPSMEDIQTLQSIKMGEEVVKEELKYREILTFSERDEQEIEECKKCIFGYEMFQSVPTTFALSSNVPVPTSYRLAPGDKIKVEYFGNSNDKKEGYISRTGIFNLPLLGPIALAGLEFDKAQKLLSNKVEQELIGTEVYLSLSEMRSINVYVVGSAYKPGSYTISSLSTLTNLIFASGGPNEEGSLREIELRRNGSLLTTFDFYDLILFGDTKDNFRLQEGDSVVFPLINNKVRIEGSVQRPGFFEILSGETLEDLIKFSGLQNRNSSRYQYSRYSLEKDVREVEILNSLSPITLQDGDSINVFTNKNFTENNVLIKGEVLYPGYYDISQGENILDIINKAGGFSEEAYPEGAVFTRESIKEQQKSSFLRNADSLERSLIDAVTSGSEINQEAYTAILSFIERIRELEPIGRQVVSVDSYSLRSDPRLNFRLQDGDSLFIPKRSTSINVVGEVLNTATHIFNDELTVNEYIELSGVNTKGADLSKIFIILPNGQSILHENKLFLGQSSNDILPGSTIVISRNPDPFDWLKVASVVTPILSDLAVSAAAIAAIQD